MTYRPQFAYPPPPRGFEDEQFHYSYDGATVPLLSSANALVAGAFANNIILPTEADAPFLARAIKIQLGTADSTLNFQLKTPRGDYMQTTPVPIARYAGQGDGAAICGKLVIPMESEIECPPSSVWTLYLYNPTSGTVNPPAVTISGVKRRKCGGRRVA
jgi:hypothetical protein